jgi:hypothetical protein
MKNLWKSVFALWVAGLAFVVSAPTQAASGVGPYYAVPSWDQTLPAATRFIVLTNMNSEAVLDRETGIVWQMSPNNAQTTWLGAHVTCNTVFTGDRGGWRLPTLQELTSLIDTSVPFPGPTLPPGHPFTAVATDVAYWSATIFHNNTGTLPLNAAWGANFADGAAAPAAAAKTSVFRVWCVRGGQGVPAPNF